MERSAQVFGDCLAKVVELDIKTIQAICAPLEKGKDSNNERTKCEDP